MEYRTKKLDGELLRIKEEILGYALDYGLDFYEVIFEVCDYDTINILASQGGFPTRYPHWQFGMAYDQMQKSYAYGLQKIYEMVINTNPCYAYLLNANHMVDQKNVMAHVYGHADFFKNNAWFKNTDRLMMDVMANHGTKIRRYMEKYGQDVVEAFIDKVLSLENLLDVDVLFKTPGQYSKNLKDKKDDLLNDESSDTRSSALKSFMNSKLKNKKKKDLVSDKEKEEFSISAEKSNASPKDVMKYLMDHAPLQDWQADVMGILREEAYYFLPQRMTKIMNEGWASYWHSTIMTQKALHASEIVDFADHHAGVMAMSKKRLNPYKIGLELFRDIEYRWNTGRFGKEYNECEDMAKKESWNKNVNLGRKKIFEVRANYNDITFIDEFFTEEFCQRQQIFTYDYNPSTGRNEIKSKDFKDIKEKLLLQLTNFGQPVIFVESGNYGNRGELLLKHDHQGVDLDTKYASDTLKNLSFLWKRPVHIATKLEEKDALLTFDGKELQVTRS